MFEEKEKSKSGMILGFHMRDKGSISLGLCMYVYSCKKKDKQKPEVTFSLSRKCT